MAIYRGAGGSGDATTDATNEASIASNAATAASTSATAAANSASNASTSATNASNSATAAASSASSASSSASTATTQASNASTSASNASTSASNAATSETNAATSASAAATSYDNFDDRYLGSKSSAPSVDNDGNTLLTGALYWNSTNSTMYAWSGSTWTAITGAGGGSGTVTSITAGTGLSGGTITTSGTIAIDSTVATLTGTQTLTNKTISGSTNTLSNIGNSSLTNSAITVNGTAIALGASGTVTATATNALTIGTGLSGTSYNGSTAVTIAIDSTVATLSGTQTLTNKTLTDPVITGAILEDIFTITDGAAFEIDPGNGTIQLITLGANRTPKATNFVNGESVTLMVLDGSAYSLTWTDATFGGSGVVWVGGSAPTLDTTKYTVIELWEVGSQVYGSLVGAA